MLMTPTLPGPSRVTPHAERMLEAIRSQRGDWLTRQDIARAIGKKRLTPWEIGLLKLFADQGLIEMQTFDTNAPSGKVWKYRAKPE